MDTYVKPQLDECLMAQAELATTGETPHLARAAKAYKRIWEATPALASPREISALQSAENDLREALLPTRIARHEMASHV
jgi:hypothetical protein